MDNITILIVNGPNLGHLGRRQPEIYGNQGMDDVPGLVRELLGPDAERISLEFFQSNGEGRIIDRLEQAWKDGVNGLVFNPGAFTHTSLAIADCLAWIKIPTIEVHLSNVWARTETIRHHSMISPLCAGVISGLGIDGYGLAVLALWRKLAAAGANG